MWTGDKVMDSLSLEAFEQLGMTPANDDKEGTSPWLGQRRLDPTCSKGLLTPTPHDTVN